MLAVGLLVLLQANGCDNAPTKPTVPEKPAAYQRFVPIPRQPENLQGVPWSGAFALDTKTGQLCKTYDWESTSNLQGLPLCTVVLASNPD
jgi:hypothetical protein